MKKSRLTKKISSLFVIMAMLVTMFASIGTVSVSAAMVGNGTDFNWWIHNNSATSSNWTCGVEDVDGSKALKVVNSNTGSGSMQILNPYSLVNMPVGKKWQLVFDMKAVTAATTDSTARVSMNQTATFGDLEASKVPVAERSGWHTYTYTTDAVVNKGNQPGMHFDIKGTGACEIYLDNVHLYALNDDDSVDKSVDYIEDGNFESGKSYGYGNPAAMTGHVIDVTGWSVMGGYGAKYDADKMNVAHNRDAANVRTGNGSLRIIRKGARNILPAPTLRILTTDSIAAGTYTLSFYVKGTLSSATATSAGSNAGLNWCLGTNKFVNMGYSDSWTVTEDSKHTGWTKWSTSITSTTAGDLRFNVSDEFDGYLDDVSLVKEGETTNLLSNGSFDIEVPDPAEYEPKNPLMISAYSTGGSINTSWRNPEKNSLSKVSLIDITDAANPVVLSDSFSTKPGDSVEYFTSGLTATTTYTYKLKFDFADGETREVIMSQKPFAYDGNNNTPTGKFPALLYASGTESAAWRLMYPFAEGGSNAYVLPANVTVDTEETYNSSNGSLHFQINRDGQSIRPSIDASNTNTWTNSYYIRLDNTKDASSTYLANKKYRIKWMMKTKNLTRQGENVGRVYLGGKDDWLGSSSYDFSAYEDWTQVTVDRDCTSASLAGGLRIYIMPDVEDMWIDNMEIWELDDNGTEVKNILASSGGFESWTDAEAVANASATAGDKSVTINYTAPTDSKYVRVYEKGIYEDEEQWKLRAVCEPTATSVTLNGLTNDTTYTYKLVSQSCLGVYSDAVTVSATPIAPDYEIESDFAFKLNNVDAEAITGNGTYSVSLNVRNNKVANFAPALIVALYKDDILVGFDKSDATLTADGVKKTLTADVAISDYDENSKYEISTFFWNGFDTMNPLLRSLSWDNK